MLVGQRALLSANRPSDAKETSEPNHPKPDCRPHLGPTEMSRKSEAFKSLRLRLKGCAELDVSAFSDTAPGPGGHS